MTTPTTTAHAVDGSSAVRATEPVTEQIDFDVIRRALKKNSDTSLQEFVDAGWTAAEFAEFARMYFLRTGKTRPTRESYRFALEFRPSSELAQDALKGFRKPGFVMPPLDRPTARPGYEHPARPDHPGHSPEVRAEVETLARLYMNQRADWGYMERPAADAPISKTLWSKCYKELDRYGSLERAIEVCGLERYR